MDLREIDLSRSLRERDAVSVRVQKSRSSVASAGRNAVELVAQSIDPETGQVRTFRIALWVADAFNRDVDKAAQAYAAIEANLLARGSGDLARFNQDLIQTMQANGASGRKRYLVRNPILAQAWDTAPGSERRESASGLRVLLERHGLALAPISEPAQAFRPDFQPDFHLPTRDKA